MTASFRPVTSEAQYLPGTPLASLSGSAGNSFLTALVRYHIGNRGLPVQTKGTGHNPQRFAFRHDIHEPGGATSGPTISSLNGMDSETGNAPP